MPERETIGAPLNVLARTYFSAVSAALETFPDGPRGYQLMESVILATSPSQLEIATSLGLDKTRTTYLIDRLVEGGLIVRESDVHDRRIKRITPTSYGIEAFEKATQSVLEKEKLVLSPLTEEEQKAFHQLLTKLHTSQCGGEFASNCVENSQSGVDCA